MWTRKEVKERGKEALKRNYWKAVLVSVLLLVMGGGAGSMAAAGSHNTANDENTENVEVIILENEEDSSISEESEALIGGMMDEMEGSLQAVTVELEQIDLAVWTAIAIVIVVCVIIIVMIAFAVDILLVNPLYVGIGRFMLKSVDGTGNVSELGYAFDHNYKNVVKATFIRDLQIFLWIFALIIPAIYKKYQYYMVDYILAENPDMPYQEVLERSKKMMDGHKWNTFVLDISFILWHILGKLTCGILTILYVKPYIELTHASLYRKLQGKVEN